MVSLWRPETAQVSDLSPSLASLVLGDRTVCLQVENRKRSRCESIPQKWACAMTCELWSPRVNRLETTISSSEEFPTVLTVVVGETETILIGQLLQLPGSFWGIYELKVKERERRGYRLSQTPLRAGVCLQKHQHSGSKTYASLELKSAPNSKERTGCMTPVCKQRPR